MSKKLAWLLSFCLLLLLAGGFLYWKFPRPIPRVGPVVTPWPDIHPAAPLNPPEPHGNPSPQPATPAEPPVKREPAIEPIFSLRPGETLEYEANLPKLNSTVANLQIVALEKRNTGGKALWHLRALVHTENPYRMVFELDDQFDSFSYSANMASLQYEMHLSEGGQKLDSVQRMLTSLRDPIPDGQSAARVLPGTRDPLGMLAYLRGVDWSPTSEVRCPVYDGRKLYDVRADVVGNSVQVKVPAGNFTTTKIELHVMDNGAEMKDAHFLLYLTKTPARLPVLLEAVLPVATVRVELTKSK